MKLDMLEKGATNEREKPGFSFLLQFELKQ
jgi:hypothetical protein